MLTPSLNIHFVRPDNVLFVLFFSTNRIYAEIFLETVIKIVYNVNKLLSNTYKQSIYQKRNLSTINGEQRCGGG